MNYLLRLCTYCDQSNTIERYENGEIICVECGVCCSRRCLEMKPDEEGGMWLHDYALRLMDAMFSDYYEHKERTNGDTMRDGIFRQFENELENNGDVWLPNYLPSLMDMMARMMKYRQGYYQNGSWHKFGMEVNTR